MSPKDRKKMATSSKGSKNPFSVSLKEVKFNNTKIFLLGTAHVSKKSVQDVKTLLSKTKTGRVAVELCPSRFQAMMDAENWKKLDIAQIIKEKKIYLLMSSVILSIFQKKIAQEFDVTPGEEMRTAIKIAHEKNLPVELIDRDIQITLKRAWHSLSFFNRLGLVSSLLASIFSKQKISEQEMEKLKNQDVLENLIEDLPPSFKFLKNVLIEERDQYMAQRLRQITQKTKTKKIFAIVGAGHVNGIEKNLLQEHDLKKLCEIPQIPKWRNLLQILAPIALILGFLIYFTDFSRLDVILRNLGIWFLLKSTLPATVTLFLKAHPLASLWAFFSGPISNFNPIFKPGPLAAFTEAKYRKPKVEDFENMAQESETLKGILHNRVLRIFVLFFMPQLASSIATAIALWLISQNT